MDCSLFYHALSFCLAAISMKQDRQIANIVLLTSDWKSIDSIG